MADSSKDLQLRELKDMITDLKQMIKTLQATVDAANKREEALIQERDNLKDEIALLRKKLFGSSSEKSPVDFPGQLNLFNEAEMEQDLAAIEAEKLSDSLAESATKKRKARTTDADRFKGIPITRRYLDLSDEEKVCPLCNTPLKKIGEEFVRRELVFIPAKLRVIEFYSINYACPNNSEHALPVIRKGKDGKPHMLYGMVSANTVAWVMYQKFCNSMPYFRQEKDWKQYGVSITRATMANWVIRNSQAFFLPMYEYFHRKLLERKFAMADETPLQVLQEPGRRAQTKSYMWLFRSGEDGGPPIILYKYSETRAGDNAVVHLHLLLRGELLLLLLGLSLESLDELLFLRHQPVRHTFQILDHAQHTVAAQVVEGLHHGDLREICRRANVHSDVQIEVLELREVERLYDLPRNALRAHKPGERVNLRRSAGLLHQLVHLSLADDGALPVIGAHHVEQNRADVLHPLVQVRPGVLQRHLGGAL